LLYYFVPVKITMLIPGGTPRARIPVPVRIKADDAVSAHTGIDREQIGDRSGIGRDHTGILSEIKTTGGNWRPG
jgi:hypothetical protein